MLLGNVLEFEESTIFQNLKNDHLTFLEVYENIMSFIKSDLNSSYKISIGTDSQVATNTVFVTCIHVHRVGKGATGFLHKSVIQRQVTNLREKIYLETCASLQLAYLFDEKKIDSICKVLGKNVTFEFHIDIGTKGLTKSLISEMVGMVKGLSFIPKIKPDSYCASCFADKYTRAI